MARNGKSTNVREREQRHELCVRQKWRCHWCGGLMIWYRGSGTDPPPPNAATTEHLDDRWSEYRGQALPGERRRVAAHKSCNENRSNERAKRVYAEEQKRRSAMR